jgi:hypothetical protein
VSAGRANQDRRRAQSRQQLPKKIFDFAAIGFVGKLRRDHQLIALLDRQHKANKGKVADWSWPWACGGCTAPKYSTF